MKNVYNFEILRSFQIFKTVTKIISPLIIVCPTITLGGNYKELQQGFGVSGYTCGYTSVTSTVSGYLWLSKLAKKDAEPEIGLFKRLT